MNKILNHFSSDQLNSYDIAKIIAISTMLIDHLAFFYQPEFQIFRVIGRISFPIFMLLIGHSNNFNNKCSLYLYLPICWSMIDVSSIIDLSTVNILPNIIISKFILSLVIRNIRNNLLWSYLLLLLIHPIVNIYFQYGSFCILLMITGNIIDDDNQQFVDKLLILIVVLGFYSLFEGWSFNFVNKLILLLLMSSLLIGTLKFRLTKITLNNSLLRKTVIKYARSSLFIYFISYDLIRLIITLEL